MKTLLLADDSITIQRVIELTFAHEAVRVISVSDGRRALEWMEAETPDIVLVDVQVPDVDGYAVAAHVRQSPRLRGVPVLLLAGAFEPVDQDRVRTLGCEGVLVKPFEPQLLVSRVKALLERAVPATLDMSAGPREAASRAPLGESATVTPFPGAGRPGVPVPSPPFFEPEPLEPPTRPVWEGAPASAAAAERLDPPSSSRVSLANAFSALLAAEQIAQPATAGLALSTPAVSDERIEDAVTRVLGRMTDDHVRRIVVEVAERLVREEIEKIKARPE